MNIDKSLGMTLVELVVVVAVVTILSAIAIPNFQSFYVRNVTSAAANDLTGALMRARAAASTRNTCVVVCRSTTAEVSGSASAQRCAGTTGGNWQSGWIIFANPSCDAAQKTPPAFPSSASNLIGVSGRLNSQIALTRQDVSGAGLSDYIMFSPLGYPRVADSGSFVLDYKTVPQKRICMNAAGNLITVASGRACP